MFTKRVKRSSNIAAIHFLRFVDKYTRVITFQALMYNMSAVLRSSIKLNDDIILLQSQASKAVAVREVTLTSKTKFM